MKNKKLKFILNLQYEMPQVQTFLEADKLERVYLFLIKMS